MARNYNPDYFKVSGSEAGSRDQAAMNRNKLGTQAASLKRAATKRPLPPPGKPRQPATAKPKQDLPSKGLRTAARAPKPASAASVAPMRATEPMATVHEIHADKPRHGKKRRSTRKRHEVDVLHELRANPQMSPREVGEAVRSPERPPAPVIDVRRAAQARGGTVPAGTMPNAAPGEPERGLFGYARRAMDTWRMMYEFAKELVMAPMTLAQLLREMKRREA